MSSMLDWALFYRSQGLSIIPVQGKIPLIKWTEFQERCASEEEIKQWWAKWPEADIGLVTGRITNRFIVDIDGPEGQLNCKRLSLPATYTVETKRGKQYHFYYPTGFKGKTTLAGLLPGVDTRGDGGYCKLPPSTFSDSSGRYSWLSEGTMDIANCPQSVIELLEAVNKPKEVSRESGESWLKEKLDGLQPGNRNQTFCSIAGRLRASGSSSNDIYLLLEPHAKEHDFDVNELRTICESVGQYAPRVQPVNTEAQSVSEVFVFKTEAEKYLEELAERGKHLEPEFCTGFGALDRLTKGFPRQNVYVIGAPTNGGKTQFVLSNILELLKRGKKVLYFSTEMPQSEIKDRFNAIGAQVSIEALTKGRLSDTEKQKLVKFINEFDTSKFVIAPEDEPNLYSITRTIEQVQPDIVFLDHIHHIKMYKENRRTEIDDFVKGFKKLVLQYNIPGVVTAQLKRKEGLDGQPVQYTMHDFKESGGIENEAGVCLLLCPPNEWTTDKVQHITAYIPKNRHGRREVRFQLEFDTETATFKEPERL